MNDDLHLIEDSKNRAYARANRIRTLRVEYLNNEDPYQSRDIEIIRLRNIKFTGEFDLSALLNMVLRKQLNLYLDGNKAVACIRGSSVIVLFPVEGEATCKQYTTPPSDCYCLYSDIEKLTRH